MEGVFDLFPILLCLLIALVIKVLTKPLDFACANLVLLLLVNSEAVSISVNQSSSCEESCPFNMGMSCNKELSKDVFFCAVHKVLVYLTSTFSIGVFWQCNARVRLFKSLFYLVYGFPWFIIFFFYKLFNICCLSKHLPDKTSS